MIRYRKVTPGQAYPLGATITPSGVNFAVFSRHASRVDICLYRDKDDENESTRIRLPSYIDGVWHGFAPGLKAGQLYGLKVYGPYKPKHGHRFNPDKLLLDPYARAITGKFKWAEEMFAYPFGENPDRDLAKDVRKNAGYMPKCVVINPEFDWAEDKRPSIPLKDSVVYEVHVKGFTKTHPDIPASLQGTYAALGSEPAIGYFKKLGITAVELLPVHHFVNDEFLEAKGLSNYWGYNSIGFFAPHADYSASGCLGGQVNEFKSMVKNLHAAGLEVWLDVVYNHTGEGNHYGPTLSFRGVDNASYYWPLPDNARYYLDHTGCGNSLNMPNPRVLQLIMDSLRYWVTEMHIDGFRFDLACTLGRLPNGFDRNSSFFNILKQDPILSQVKLIAEPWDISMGGYQVGNFPSPFAEWNGKFRDCVRGFWKGDEGLAGEFAKRITGSSDMFQWDERTPSMSVNFVVAHDGFTLGDLVSYNEKHNDANGEDNRDGESHNRSWNCGVEGPTGDPEILKLRRRQMRNLLSTLFLSHGVPMLCAGDEYGRSQKGNNNGYCQDNELSWQAWNRTPEEQQQEEFTAKLIALKREQAAFRRKDFEGKRTKKTTSPPQITWFGPDGRGMSHDAWHSPVTRTLGVIFSPEMKIPGSTFAMVFNAHHEPMEFLLPGKEHVRWKLIVNTAEEAGFVEAPDTISGGAPFKLESRSVCIFQQMEGSQRDGHTLLA